VQIRIEGTDLPGASCGPSPDPPGGYHNIHVAVQRRHRRVELGHRSDAPIGHAPDLAQADTLRDAARRDLELQRSQPVGGP
jgi:hypothetical protein